MKKAKQDFCFPFYFQRYLSGTMGFTPEMHGAYLLAMIYQFQNGHFSEDSINRVIDGKFDIIKHKYETDEDGLYFNETMEEVIIDRKNFIETKRNNRLGKTKDKLQLNGSSSVVPLQGSGGGDGSIGVVKKKKNKHLDCVMLTDEELIKLEELFPNSIDERIAKLDEYVMSVGKKYKSHYHTLLSWARRDGWDGKPETDRDLSIY